jgi:CRP-like cAMP-binding protein
MREWRRDGARRGDRAAGSMRLFRSLPAFELEAIARAGTDRLVPASTALNTEGEFADGYFAIADGAVEATSGGRHLATLGRGEGFGEIGLLRNIRRTASVTAATDALLLAIERHAFIAAVTGHSECMQQARSIIDERLTESLPSRPAIDSAAPR